MGPIKIINNIITNMTTTVNTTITSDATTTPELQNVTTTDMVKANLEDWHFTVYAILLGIAFACISLWVFREYIMEKMRKLGCRDNTKENQNGEKDVKTCKNGQIESENDSL